MAKVKTAKDFDSMHNKAVIVPNKIRAGIKKLGPRGWEYWGAFLAANGVSTSDANGYIEQFDKFTLMVPREKKRIICGSEALATEFRKKV